MAENNTPKILLTIFIFLMIMGIVGKCALSFLPKEDNGPKIYRLLEVEYVNLDTADTLKILLNTRQQDDTWIVMDQEWIDPNQNIKILRVSDYGN